MQRSIVDALPNVNSPAVPSRESTNVLSRRPLPTWLLVFGFWTLIVLA